MADKPKINEKELNDAAKKDPASKRHNNANSRKNLKQYQETVVPEVLDADREDDAQAQEITVGRKLSPELIKKL
ncbi:hypothetical protein LCGC14_3129390, partial [marine sediment metagenome]